MSLFISPEHRKLLLTTLRMMNVKKLVVTFSGSGDSGSIDEPVAYDAAGEQIDLSETDILWPHNKGVFNDKTLAWDTVVRQAQQRLPKILKDLTNDALDEQHIDWYNNEGGQGEFTIDFHQDPPEIELHVGVNEMVTHDHAFNYSFDNFTEGETCTRTTTHAQV